MVKHVEPMMPMPLITAAHTSHAQFLAGSAHAAFGITEDIIAK